MAALQNLYVIPFALFSLYSLTQPGKIAFTLACCGAILATYTSGNGLFTFVAGAPLLLFVKSYRQLAIWALIGAITIALYFLDYIRPPYHPDIYDSLVNHTGRAIRYFFSLTGSMVGIGRPGLAVIVGLFSLAVTLGLLGYLWSKKRIPAHLTLIGWLLFLYLTCLSLMASRSGLGVEQAFSPRYGIVVVVLFATQAMLAIETVRKGWLRLGVLVAYLAVALFFYLSPTNQGNRQRIVDRTRELQYNTAIYNNDSTNLFLHWGNSDAAKPIFADAIHKGIYQVPPLTFQDLKSSPQPFDATGLAASNQVTYQVQPFIHPQLFSTLPVMGLNRWRIT